MVRIGVFIPSEAQLLDVATVDVLGTISKEYLSVLPHLPAHVKAGAPSVTIVYITSPKNGGEIPSTSSSTLKSHHTYQDDAVAPGKLDVIVVPGDRKSVV